MTDNDRVVKHLERLGHLYFALDKQERGYAFFRAAEAVRELDYDIARALPELMRPGIKIKYIGKSTRQEIEEVLARGTSARMEQLEQEISEKKITVNVIDQKTIELLKTVGGLDLISSIQFYIRYHYSDIKRICTLAQSGAITDEKDLAVVHKLMECSGPG